MPLTEDSGLGAVVVVCLVAWALQRGGETRQGGPGLDPYVLPLSTPPVLSHGRASLRLRPTSSGQWECVTRVTDVTPEVPLDPQDLRCRVSPEGLCWPVSRALVVMHAHLGGPSHPLASGDKVLVAPPGGLWASGHRCECRETAPASYTRDEAPSLHLPGSPARVVVGRRPRRGRPPPRPSSRGSCSLPYSRQASPG